MRNRRYTNFIQRHFLDNISIYTFIMVLFLMGIIFGAVIVNSLSSQHQEDLFFYLGQFFSQVGEGEMVPQEELLKSSFLHNVKMAGLIWIMGISIIGFPLIFLLLFLKGIVVGFSVGFLVHQMGWNGLLLAFGSLLPQNIFIIPVFIYIAANAVGLSIKLIKKIFVRQSPHYPLVPVFAKYILGFIVALVVLTVAASVEAFISPILMKTIISTFING